MTKREVTFELNLVPMIDLLSVMISFLLFTAVWTQVSRIDVRQQPESADSPTPQAPDEPSLGLRILIKAGGYAIATDEALIKEIAGYDLAALAQVLARPRTEHAGNHAVVVASEDRVPYQELISVMDLCLIHELRDISVSGL